MLEENIKTKNLAFRPPVVVVMGHIDHGKTTLLDFIRKSKVAEHEAGQITQHIGAYQALAEGRIITFLDTPGHEAFTKIRSRGARVADIAILVVGADEGIKPQTLEALSIIQNAKIPFIVAINKMDRSNADANKIRQQFADKGVLLEGWGGNVPNQEISAKLGQGVPELLELILLTADLAELKADAKCQARGIILETNKDSQRGVSATVLVQEGTLRKGDFFTAGPVWGRVKLLQDFAGHAIEEAAPSSPVVVGGFDDLPEVGETFEVSGSKDEAMKKSEQIKIKMKEEMNKDGATQKTGVLQMPVILRGDVTGSLEGMMDILGKMKYNEAEIKVISKDMGDVNENDVKLASASGASIFAFNVKANSSVLKLAERLNVRIFSANVVYELTNKIKEELEKSLEPETFRTDVGKAQILASFKHDSSRQIVGGRVLSGKISKGTMIEVMRAGKIIGKGKISQLQQNKKDVEEIGQGEFGIMVSPQGALPKIEERDNIIIFEQEQKERHLTPWQAKED
ncbi:MAG: Translation initiation factor IF-2 protein [Parcubacteria group bacterium GW2011_GWA2_39_18]|nr:MAG: Translation initiation factor IF-2 protein [Parcubacteria group bacterium GW2011_GWA2_39_18]